MFLRLAAEFQEYARFLHTLASDMLVSACADGKISLAVILSRNFLTKRDLDSYNACAESVTNDFHRLGLTIWDALTEIHEARQTEAWKRTLAHLNTARNAVAHNDADKFESLSKANIVLSLETFKRWHQELDGLVTAMDEVVGDYLSELLTVDRPW